MTPEERAKWLGEVRARADAASPAPWNVTRDEVDARICEVWADGCERCIAVSLEDEPRPDAAFIAAARSDVPALLALVGEFARAIVEAEHDGVGDGECAWCGEAYAGGWPHKPGCIVLLARATAKETQ